ncbi:hypothetical protein [Paraburkholderia tagetis]|uniref:Uncharacterized protein n=1 Tax=Paraburkholderia tagetis TaxID=2913261 RepID=A0A9X1UPU7_9BURK|nr:hypothetical protein [Paraburkholderia tagetis]MCG5079006.1 hypothetical protein [Paraburkholderia tagetis]
MFDIPRSTTVIALVALCAVAHATQPAHLVGHIDIPGVSLNSFDIRFAEQGIYALADQSNASVDLIGTHNRRFLAKLGGFAGVRKADLGRPNGVVIVGGHQVWAGDGAAVSRSLK